MSKSNTNKANENKAVNRRLIEDCVHGVFLSITQSIHETQFLTLVQTPGKYGFAQLIPHETMPSRRPLHIRGPPESPCRSARQIRDDDDVYEVGIVHINKTVNEPELASLPAARFQGWYCQSVKSGQVSSTRFIMTFYSDIHSPRSFLVATRNIRSY